jgi:Protein of unknown function (DUF1552)
MNTPTISRRTVLRGLGTVLALPWLECMGNVSAWAAAAGPGRTAPNRMAFVYVPNGKDMANWTPSGVGDKFTLPDILEPLAPHQKDIVVLTGLAADKARPHGDGAGDHARAMGAFLTGAQPRKTDGADIRCGTSVDQLAAQRLEGQTHLDSLELGCESGNMAGNCDSGYSCVYSSTLSWRSATQPIPKEVNPKLVFERLFGSQDNVERTRRAVSRKSVLDYIREDARTFTARLGRADQQKMDEYFTSVRDIEQRIARTASLAKLTPPSGFKVPTGIPGSYDEHIRQMIDLMVLAFQMDATRVCTFVMANEGSNRAYSHIGVNEGHHELSHHGNDSGKKEKIKKINLFHMGHFAYLLERMKGIREGNGTLLDHSMIVYGSGNSDGNRHNHDDLPVLLAGRGGGTIKTGRHIRMNEETPISNLWVSMLERIDVRSPVGDSTGPLKSLAG